jgi:hypothetical protein
MHNLKLLLLNQKVLMYYRIQRTYKFDWLKQKLEKENFNNRKVSS